MAASASARVEQLRREIRRHDHLYYVENKPSISDREYDALMRELIDLETKHPDLTSPDSPSQRLGDKPLEAFRAVAHAVPMMSIDNTYDEAEVRAFDQRVHKALAGQTPRYVVEEKVDGVAVNLRYEKGSLVQAATRGDGSRGDEVTANVRTIAAIPLRLPDSAPAIMEVRGEIFMTNAEFARLNQSREEAAEEVFANPRNSTAGTLKLLDPKIVAQRRLRFIAHGAGQVEPMPVECYWDWINLLRKLGIPTAQHTKRVDNIDAVIAEIERFAKIRHELAYQTDGMVVKVDDIAQRQLLGERSKAPRWVIAYKYQPDQVETKLLEVTWQVGKLGTLTPVAELEPVFVAGTTVKRASLHNIDQIRRLDVRIGDRVVIEKAGEIIPQVVKAVTEKRPRGTKEIELPRKCPSCGAKTHKPADTPYVLCINPACPAQLRGRLRWFCARGQMNIEHLGEALIDQLVEHKLIKTFADIYRLKKDDLLGLERMAEKSAANVIDSIAAARDRSLNRLLAGLNIRHVGNRVATVLAEHFGSLDALGKATVEELSAVHEIGDVIAQSVHEFFHDPAGIAAIEQLKSAGINPKMEAKADKLPLSGQTIVVTGTLEKYKREEIEELIQKLGGRASGSVSKKTSFIVAGKEAGSKLEKAKELNIKVRTESEFDELIGRK
jgi:DNA ligase (NAD+)